MTDGASPPRPDVRPAALDRRDLRAVEPLLPALRTAFRRYFRLDIAGLDHFPAQGPALVVANHSGGGWSPDAAAFLLEFLDRFGTERSVHFLAHGALMKTPGLGPALERFGVMPASRSAARAALDEGACVIVFPGGEYDLHRPFGARHQIRFHGRTGFAEMALDTGVPVLPVVMAGGQNTYLPIADGHLLARWTGFRRLTGVKVLPVAAGLPFGFTVGNLLGWLPLPARIRIRVLEAVDPHRFAEPLGLADHVVKTMQATLDELTSA